MNDDHQSAEASSGARLNATLDRRRAAISGEHATTLIGRGEELPRAYPAEILEDAAGGFVASFPDLPEAPSTAGADASELRARLPRALLTGLRQIVGDGRRMLPPSEAHGRARILSMNGQPLDTRSATGRLMLTMLAAVVAFGRDLMLERQREGVAKAKAEGAYKGRKPTARAKSADVLRLRAEGVAVAKIARRLDIGTASVWRILAPSQRP